MSKRDDIIRHLASQVDSIHLDHPTRVAIDGVFLLRKELGNCWDYSIFVDAGFSTTVKRALTRDVELFGSAEEVERRYSTRYVPGQKIYLSLVEPARLASVVIENDDPTNPSIRERAI